jgi:hypothetical protein
LTDDAASVNTNGLLLDAMMQTSPITPGVESASPIGEETEGLWDLQLCCSVNVMKRPAKRKANLFFMPIVHKTNTDPFKTGSKN